MEKRRYNNFLYVISYLLVLRVVLMVTTDVSVFNFGIFFDVVLIMFWIYAFGILLKKKKVQKTYFVFVVLFSTVILSISPSPPLVF